MQQILTSDADRAVMAVKGISAAGYALLVGLCPESHAPQRKRMPSRMPGDAYVRALRRIIWPTTFVFECRFARTSSSMNYLRTAILLAGLNCALYGSWIPSWWWPRCPDRAPFRGGDEPLWLLELPQARVIDAQCPGGRRTQRGALSFGLSFCARARTRPHFLSEKCLSTHILNKRAKRGSHFTASSWPRLQSR